MRKAILLSGLLLLGQSAAAGEMSDFFRHWRLSYEHDYSACPYPYSSVIGSAFLRGAALRLEFYRGRMSAGFTLEPGEREVACEAGRCREKVEFSGSRILQTIADLSGRLERLSSFALDSEGRLSVRHERPGAVPESCLYVPDAIEVQVGAPKSPGYWHGYNAELGYVTVYSPNVELYGGIVLRAEWTMENTWRALYFGRYVWVYLARSTISLP
ncbi:MAG: hypothetical protein HY921_04390 [Elusimicrobia bacterium]|nr:hypothetical protein [Elusimicrobiota bacterium]